MKNIIASVVVAAGAVALAMPATAQVTGSAPTADNLTICATEGTRGWKLTGTPGATFTDWDMNKIIGQIVGDGNCQEGWAMLSSVDPRIMLGNGIQLNNVDTATDRVVTDTNTVVTTADAGRITAAYQGFAPEVLKGRPNHANDKWKLVAADGNGGGTYKVKRPGNTTRSKGDTLLFTSQMLEDRDHNGTCTTNAKWCRNFRYGASRDTTTVTEDYVTTTTRTYTYTGTRVFCPSVWTYTFVSPNGDAVGNVQGRVGECQEKRYTITRVESFDRNGSTTTSTVGDKYVTPQN